MPSRVLRVRDEWAGFQIDSCVATIGLAIENHSQERVNYGSEEEPDWQNKYTLAELLDPEFQISVEDTSILGDLDFASIEGVTYDEVR